MIFTWENWFENVICKLAAILSQPQCVDSLFNGLPPTKSQAIIKNNAELQDNVFENVRRHWWSCLFSVHCVKSAVRILSPHTANHQGNSRHEMATILTHWSLEDVAVIKMREFQIQFGIYISSVQVNITLEWMPEYVADGNRKYKDYVYGKC